MALSQTASTYPHDCHPDRSRCFAKRSNDAVEGPLLLLFHEPGESTGETKSLSHLSTPEVSGSQVQRTSMVTHGRPHLLGEYEAFAHEAGGFHQPNLVK